MRTELKRTPNLKSKVTILITILLFPVTAYTNTIEFQWDSNPEPLTGYKLYYKTGTDNTPPYDGTGLNEGDSPITIDKSTTFSVSGLQSTKTYHFALKAYYETTESDFSMSTITIPATELPSPVINLMSQAK